MPQTIEATIDEPGNVRLLEPIQLSEPRRAVVTFFNYERDCYETALLNEANASLNPGRVRKRMPHGRTYNRGSCLSSFSIF